MHLTSEEKEGIELINLTHEGETVMSIAPRYGARLVNLKLQKAGSFRELLWPVSMEDLKTNEWFKNTLLFPYPNRLEDGKYTFEGKDYEFPINEPDKNNQLHGMLFSEPFTLKTKEIEKESAKLAFEYTYDGSQSYYPFPFNFILTYRYTPQSLNVDFEVTNTGNENLPYGVGWHPYFQLDGHGIEGYEISTPTLELLLLSERSLPSGKSEPFGDNPIKLATTKLDNAFRIVSGKNQYSLSDAESGITLDFEATAGFEYIQLFTPNMEAVAIEPMTCNINALNNGEGLRVLQPKQNFEGSFSIKIR